MSKLSQEETPGAGETLPSPVSYGHLSLVNKQENHSPNQGSKTLLLDWAVEQVDSELARETTRLPEQHNKINSAVFKIIPQNVSETNCIGLFIHFTRHLRAVDNIVLFEQLTISPKLIVMHNYT